MSAEPETLALGAGAGSTTNGAEVAAPAIDASQVPTPPALKPPVDPSALLHRQLQEGPFWQQVPAYAAVTEAEFLDHKWQAKHSITQPPKLLAALKGLVPDE